MLVFGAKIQFVACCRKQPLLATWTTGESKYMNLALNLALSVRRNAPHLERTEKSRMTN